MQIPAEIAATIVFDKAFQQAFSWLHLKSEKAGAWSNKKVAVEKDKYFKQNSEWRVQVF